MAARFEQVTLGREQVSEFYHDVFVSSQVRDFDRLCRVRGLPRQGVVVDVGGGCGFFAAAVRDAFGAPVRVVDMDPVSVERARALGLDARSGDALAPELQGDEALVCFNLILHHLVGGTDAATRALQLAALRAWRRPGVHVFVNEYVYESPLRGFSARAIFEVTSSRLLSAIARVVGRLVSSLRANTLGVGVRFRESADWRSLFEEAGYRVLAAERGEEETVSLARAVLLIKSCRRDSFLLCADSA